MPVFVLACCAAGLGLLPQTALAQGRLDGQKLPPALTIGPVTPTLSVPAWSLPPVAAPLATGAVAREINPRRRAAGHQASPAARAGQVDALLAVQRGVAPAQDGFTTPQLNFDGLSFTGVVPPDPVGDVGLEHYVQMVNNIGGSLVAVYSKATGEQAIPPFLLGNLAPADSPCRTSKGDPIVLYDELAQRWLLTDFTNVVDSLCVYVSQTADPTGAYFAYRFPTPEFPDYPKYAVWPAAYLVTTNESEPAIYALDRGQLLTGAAATMQRFTAPPLSGFSFQALTPGDLDGAAPPAGSPAYFARQVDTEAHGPAGEPLWDFIEVWSLVVDWATPANSTFSLAAYVPVAEFDSDLCGLFSFFCFPQPNGGALLDPLREVIMWRLQYRNFGAYATLVGNFVTDVDGNDHGGVRWFELRKQNPAGNWQLHQEGTFAPDGDDRWMGSAAMDNKGNLAVGFNVVGESTFASLRYAGRRYTDTLNTLPVGEVSLATGERAGSSQRFGDYNALTVDPVDGCTFWFTGEYDASSNWKTRIGTFRFSNCSDKDFGLAVHPSQQELCLAQGDVVTYAIGITGRDGFDAPVTLQAVGAPGTAAFSVNPVLPGQESVLSLAGPAAGSYTFAIVGTAALTPALVHTQTAGVQVARAEAITVTTTADSGAGSLRQALAEVCTGGAVGFAGELAGQVITLTTGALAVQRSVTITGLGSDELALTASSGNRILEIGAGVTATVYGLTLRDAVLEEPDSGGAIRNLGRLTLDRVVLTGNRSPNGGALRNHGEAILQECVITHNHASSDGGALLNDNGVLSLQACTVSHNSAGANGGALASYGGQLALVASTVAENSAGNSGGALYGIVARMNTANSTLAGNEAAFGGGIYVTQGSVLTVTSSTVASNTTQAAPPDGSPSFGHSLIVGYSTAYLSNTVLAQNGVNLNCYAYGEGSPLRAGIDNLATDSSCDRAMVTTPAALALAPLGDYGGATPTVALLPNSAAIDHGPAAGCPPVDQRGIVRPQGQACDAGAFESRGFTLAVVGGNVQSAPVGSLFPQSLTVLVTSPFSEPVDGGQVVYLPPQTGPSAALTPSTTSLIVGGVATVQAIANRQVGAYSILAGAIGAGAGGVFRLANVPWLYDLFLPVISQEW